MEKYATFYHSGVKQDVKEAKDWYRSQLKGLEKRFSENIEAAILRLRQNPFAHAIRYKNIRVAHPARFPYAIHYYIEEMKHKIIIIAIVHNNRSSVIPQKRIAEY